LKSYLRNKYTGINYPGF